MLPDPTPEPFIWSPGIIVPTYEEVSVYPNPNDGDFINIDIRGSNSFTVTMIEIWNLTGLKLTTMSLSENTSTLKLPSGLQGAYIYRITGDGRELRTGKILVAN